MAIHFGAAIEKRRDEVAADGDAGQNGGEHQREAVHRGPEKEREHAEPDDLEREGSEARHRKHDQNQIQAAAVEKRNRRLSRPGVRPIGELFGGRP